MNKLGLANVSGIWRPGALTPLTVTVTAESWLLGTDGTAKLIWFEETYSRGARTEPTLMSTPASEVVE
jgi:hypothetical protein